MSAEDLIAKVSGRCDSKLIKTTRLEKLSTKRQEFLSKLYEENDLNSRLLGTLLNGVYTEQKKTFLMSLPLLRTLIMVDYENGNFNRNTLNDQEYKKFVAILRKNQIIDVLIESEKKSSKHPNGLAATWQILDQDALKILDVELDEYDGEGYPWDYDDQLQTMVNQDYFESLYNKGDLKRNDSIKPPLVVVPTDTPSQVRSKKKYIF